MRTRAIESQPTLLMPRRLQGNLQNMARAFIVVLFVVTVEFFKPHKEGKDFMSSDLHFFLDGEQEFLCGQELADAIRAYGVLRFNDVRKSKPSWQPNLSQADLSVLKQKPAKPQGIEGKMLRDPNDWRPSTGMLEQWTGDARYINFSGANLAKANLSGINLTSANFQDADLRGATLQDAQARRADFSSANLEDACLSQADLFEANLTQANLRQADLRSANLYGANVTPQELSRTILNSSTVMPSGDSFGNPDSMWTIKIVQARGVPTADLASLSAEFRKKVEAGLEAAAREDSAAEEAEAPLEAPEAPPPEEAEAAAPPEEAAAPSAEVPEAPPPEEAEAAASPEEPEAQEAADAAPEPTPTGGLWRRIKSVFGKRDDDSAGDV
jgi:uncharacterized protein YjbI with pentapeptide repeats